MDFYAVLDQVIDLLKQRGKASYRALKLQFTLDDASLDVLKDELIKVHQLARDQDGEMLVWTGETATVQTVAAPPAQTTPPAAAQGEPLLQVESPPLDARSPEAERRQLTVMFCDVVDSTLKWTPSSRQKIVTIKIDYRVPLSRNTLPPVFDSPTPDAAAARYTAQRMRLTPVSPPGASRNLSNRPPRI
jgi:hypothetical protein